MGGVGGACLFAAGGLIYFFSRRSRPRSRLLVQSPEMSEVDPATGYGDPEHPSTDYLTPITTLRYPEEEQGGLSARTLGGYN